MGYTSDARGLRQSRTVDGVTDRFTWSSAGGLPLLLDDGQHSYLYGPSSTPVAQVDDSTGQIEYLHSDLLGTPRLLSNASGSAVGSVSFDAFGNRATYTGTQSAFGFTGNWTDPDTDLVYLRARDYDPATGQFLSVDPAVDVTRQPYAYVGNNPISRTDPTGLDYIDPNSLGAQILTAVSPASAGFIAVNNRMANGDDLGTALNKTYNPVYQYAHGFSQWGRYSGFDCPIGAQAGAAVEGFIGLIGIAAIAAGPIMAGGRAGAGATSGAAGSGFSRFGVDAAGEATMHLRAGTTSLEVSEHAALRLAERGISIDVAEATLAQPSFPYFHNTVWKTG